MCPSKLSNPSPFIVYGRGGMHKELISPSHTCVRHACSAGQNYVARLAGSVFLPRGWMWRWPTLFGPKIVNFRSWRVTISGAEQGVVYPHEAPSPEFCSKVACGSQFNCPRVCHFPVNNCLVPISWFAALLPFELF